MIYRYGSRFGGKSRGPFVFVTSCHTLRSELEWPGGLEIDVTTLENELANDAKPVSNVYNRLIRASGIST